MLELHVHMQYTCNPFVFVFREGRSYLPTIDNASFSVRTDNASFSVRTAPSSFARACMMKLDQLNNYRHEYLHIYIDVFLFLARI